jgi:hypothetical protein
MTKIKLRLILLIGFALSLILAPTPKQVSAQWPPFNFDLTPVYENGKITYHIELSRQVDWALTDVDLKILLPEGTRFLEAAALPTTRVDFDGTEITFFTAVLHRPLRNTSFTVGITDPARTTFTTHAWIAWKGNQPGDYLTEDVSLDLTQQPLAWAGPRSRLRLEAGAIVADDVITYLIYPKNVGERRMWDLQIEVPLPEGTTFLSAEAPLPFVTSFDGREISFSTIELKRKAEISPLLVKVSAAEVTSPLVVTHAWATWKNVGRSVGRSVAFQEEVRTGDIIIQSDATQQVVSDTIGDTPFSNYDLTSIILQEDRQALKITFNAVGDLGPVGEPLEYILYIDSDCRIDTGGKRGNRGAEYWVRYRHKIGQAYIYSWNNEENVWDNRQPLEVNNATRRNMIIVWVPYDLLESGQQFCWIGRTRNITDTYYPNLPSDWVGRDPRLTRYEAVTEPIPKDF